MEEDIRRDGLTFKRIMAYCGIVLVALIILILLVEVVRGEADSQIGIIDAGTYYKAWNNGPVANVTYFDKDSGMAQLSNELNRFGDVTYFYGVARNMSGTWRYYSTDDLPVNMSIYSDNLSYYWAVGYKSFGLSGSWFLQNNNSQKLYDELVSIEFQLVAPRNFLGEYYFIRQLRNMDVEQDGIGETIILTDRQGLQQWAWNKTETKTFNDIVKVEIHGLVYHYDMVFQKPQLVVYNKSSSTKVNGDLSFFEYIGNVQANRTYVFQHNWMDAFPCVINCFPGCSVNIQQNASHIRITQGQKVSETRVRYQVFCIGESGVCTLTDCYMGIVSNHSVLAMQQYQWVVEKNPDYPLACFDNTCKLEPSTTYKRFNSTGSQKGIYRGWGACIAGSEIGNASGCTVKAVDFWVNVTVQGINVTLIHPPNRTNTSNSSVFFSMQANRSIDNCSLYLNNTFNYTMAANFSGNILFGCPWLGNWTGLCCFSNNCAWDWQGNFSLYTYCLPSAPAHRVEVPQKRRDSMKLDDGLVYLIGGGIVVFMSLIFILVVRKRPE